MYVCLCKGITEADLHRAARAGVVTADGLTRAFGLDDTTCCGRCVRNIDEVVAVARGERSRLRPLPMLRRSRQVAPRGV